MPDLKTESSMVSNPAPRPRESTGLTFHIANDLDEVNIAWEMVYVTYLRAGLIEPNPHRIHTAPQMIGPHSVVITGRMGPLTVSTLTALESGPLGLPLDRVYPAELAALRRDGHRLMEVGLFADRRTEISRTTDALFHLMRYAFHFALHTNTTDFVIGVHPRHARFYSRAFGFEPYGDLKTYPAVNNRPVVLLRGDLEAKLKLQPLHPALDFFVKNPLEPGVFEERFKFEPAFMAGSPLEQFLQDYERNACNSCKRVAS